MSHSAFSEAVGCVGWAETMGMRNTMEDGWCYVDALGGNRTDAFLALYDGHGGRETTDYLIQELHVKVQDKLRAGYSASEALVVCMKEVDADLLRRNITRSGATGCCCLVQKDITGERWLTTAHLGDTRGVLCRGDKAIRLTSATDHKATCPIEVKRVESLGGSVVRGRVNGFLSIARAFGDMTLKAPFNNGRDFVSADADVSEILLRKDDSFLILACDGVWDVLDDDCAVDILTEARKQLHERVPDIDPRVEAELLSRMLLEEATAKGSTDNISVLVALLSAIPRAEREANKVVTATTSPSSSVKTHG